MSKLSKRYGISDVGLAKICRRMDIPVPPRGYWARIAHGQKITKPRLPALKAGMPESIEISPPSEHTLFTKAIHASLEEPADPTEEITVDEVLTKPHPLIRAAEKSLKKSQPDTYGRLTTSNGDIDVRVGRSSISRAMLIMDAVMKAFDARGYTVKFKEDYGLGSYVIVDGQSIPFSLDAASKRFDIPASKQKDSWSPKVEYTARIAS